MARLTDPQIQRQIRSDLLRTIELAGFDPEDFVMTAGRSAEPFGPPGMELDVLTVSRRSTGHSQVYAISPSWPWLFTAFADLTAGRFGARAPSGA